MSVSDAGVDEILPYQRQKNSELLNLTFSDLCSKSLSPSVAEYLSTVDCYCIAVEPKHCERGMKLLAQLLPMRAAGEGGVDLCHLKRVRRVECDEGGGTSGGNNSDKNDDRDRGENESCGDCSDPSKGESRKRKQVGKLECFCLLVGRNCGLLVERYKNCSLQRQSVVDAGDTADLEGSQLC